jgi:chemotaxis protein methyltransferase CheR
MASHLTNNETYFFREQPQLQIFADNIVKEIKERKSQEGAPRRVRVLSAGCSTGEEPLTLAMILYDSGHFFWNWDVRVTGLDLDQEALDKAGRGLYHQNSLRALNAVQLDRHFVREGPAVRVKEAIRKLVTFRRGNLVDPASYEGLAPLDVVFCRNVLIYFSDEATRRAIQAFHDLLAPGGYLFLGHAESLSRITAAFTPIRFQGAMVYQKPGRP